MSKPRRNWTRQEVEAVVADYFDMYEQYLRGVPFKKTDHWRALQTRLQSRTKQSIEFKYRNISASLIELGRPCLPGYVPAHNRQQLLFDVVEQEVRRNRTVTVLLHDLVTKVVDFPRFDDILNRLTEPPHEDRTRTRQVRERSATSRSTVDFLLADANHAILGRAGEHFVIDFEVARLLSLGAPGWAAKVEHVAVTRGDHEGYDVLSYDVSGKERLIEVKTTAFSVYTPFFVSRNQVELSQREEDKFFLYRPFDFHRNARVYYLPGALPTTCVLEPATYAAWAKPPVSGLV